MRALLVVNPRATTTSPRARDVLARALETEVTLDVAHTSQRGHAAELAAKAVVDGAELVVSLGGDGTVNEVVNGVLSGAAIDPNAANRPAVAVVPGGSANVFARALGISPDPIEATGQLLEAIRGHRFRSVGLGLVAGRWFTFCAGFGLDAAVAHRVEQARERGKTSTPNLYMRSITAQIFSKAERSAPTIQFSVPEQGLAREPVELSLAIVQNTAPWTYLGSRAISPAPDASFDTGLDLVGLRRPTGRIGRATTFAHTATTAIRLLMTGAAQGREMMHAHDLSEFSLAADRPLAFQVDGDYLGERDSLTFSSVSNALRVAV